MLDKLKKLLGYGGGNSSQQAKTSISINEVTGSEKGSAIIAMTLNMLVDEMKKSYPEWNGLFSIAPNNGHVVVTCLKGFSDEHTRKAIPCLWRRKSFIENCRLMGVHRIIFMDSTNKTFDLLKIEDIDINELP
jgi:hypothetical protein